MGCGARGKVAVGIGVAGIVAALAGCTAPPVPEPSPTPTAPCIAGEWSADAGELQPLYDAIPSGLDYPAATLGPESSVVVVFAADGTFRLSQDVSVTLEWEGHAAAISLGGTMAGTYTASDGALAMTSTDNALTSSPADDRTGSVLFAAATQETLTEWPVSASSYDCADDTLKAGLDTEGHDATVAFTRR